MNKFVLLFFITIAIFGSDKTVKMPEVNNNKEIKISDEILKYISLEGYLRLGANLRGNYDLNSFYLRDANTKNEKVVGSSKHLPTIKELKKKSSSQSTVSYSTRFRLSPNIIVGEYLRAVTTIDVFDNTLFGNKADVIIAKEAYFEGKTPFGIFRIGRITTDWGLGIYRNSGKGKFSNYGDYIDQIQYEVGNFFSVMPYLSVKLAYEVKDSGPNSNDIYGKQTAPAYDMEDRDDYVGFSLYVENKLKGQALRNLLQTGKNHINYGLYLGKYWKNKDIKVKKDPNKKDSSYTYDSYDLDYYVINAYMEFYYNTIFDVKAEFVNILGSNEKDKFFYQWGLLLQSNVHLLMNTLSLGFDLGLASHDTSDESNPYYKMKSGAIKVQRNNYTFNPDFDVDLMFFKEIYDLSGLYYIKPHLSWLATENISISLWSVTAFAFNKNNTYGRNTYLGTEIDTSIEYLNRDGLNFGIRSGLYIPGDGMDWLGESNAQRGGTGEEKDQLAELAYTIQAFLILKF